MKVNSGFYLQFISVCHQASSERCFGGSHQVGEGRDLSTWQTI